MSNTVAVAIRDSGDVVLVDCGWSEEACADPKRILGRARARLLGVELRAGDGIAAQLRRLGIDRSRVTTIIATHFHLDHIGGAIDFPNAEIVCSDVELSAFRSIAPRNGYRLEDITKSSRLRPITIDGSPSYGFPNAHDLFGDGEIALLDAPGHTAGSAAVALRARGPGGRCFVHVGDAVYQTWEYAITPRGPSLIARFTAWRRPLLESHYAHLRACEADLRRPQLVPSHDLAVYETLPHAPDVRVDAHVAE